LPDEEEDLSKPAKPIVRGVIALAAAGSLVSATPSAPGYRVDVAGMDRAVKPGDDFYAFANGGWMKITEIPADRAVYGAFTAIDEDVHHRLRDLIQSAGSGAAASGRQIQDFYDAYMDEEAIEKRGLAPIQAEIDEIAKISDRASLSRVLGSQLRADVDALNNTHFHTDRPFGLWAAPEFAHPERYAAYLFQGGLGLPDRDYYRKTDDKSRELQSKYRAHIVTVLGLAKIPDAASQAERIYGLEQKIAEVHVSRTDSVDVHKADNPWTPAEFATRAPGIDWTAYFGAAGLAGQPVIMVWHATGVAGIAGLVGSEPLSVWKEYLTFRAIDRASGLLPRAFAEEQFRFYGTALTGALKPRDRWKRAVTATSVALGDEVGQLYVAKYFPAQAKAEAQAMVKNIIAAFGRRIDALSWMSPATRTKARAKLETLYVGIGYPEHWRSYDGLKIAKDDALGNQQRAELFEYRGSLAKLGKPVDKTEWCMTPQTVNAVNLPLQNALNFPAAILNPPFYDAAGDPVKNYGAIGTVIGHEISHSFDDQGSQFDADGRLVNWWTPEDLAHFQAAGARLIAQYDAYEPLPGMHINGKLTLSENIADVAGVSAAYDGYRAAYAKALPPPIEGLSSDQRFFLGFGQIWRSKARPQALRNQLLTDGHSPGTYRADTVRNVDAWYAAFDVAPGQTLYLTPEARVRVW
jgi:putative endopeptidase